MEKFSRIHRKTCRLACPGGASLKSASSCILQGAISSVSAYTMFQKPWPRQASEKGILRLQLQCFVEVDSGREYEWTLIKKKLLFWGAFGKMKGKEGVSMETETEKSESKSRWAGLLTNARCFLIIHLRHGTDLASQTAHLYMSVAGSWCVLSMLLMPCRPSAHGVNDAFHSTIHFALWKCFDGL